MCLSTFACIYILFAWSDRKTSFCTIHRLSAFFLLQHRRKNRLFVARFDCFGFNMFRENVRSSSIIICWNAFSIPSHFACLFLSCLVFAFSPFLLFVLWLFLQILPRSLSNWFSFRSLHSFPYATDFLILFFTISKANYKYGCDFHFKFESVNIFKHVCVCMSVYSHMPTVAYIYHPNPNDWQTKPYTAFEL